MKKYFNTRNRKIVLAVEFMLLLSAVICLIIPNKKYNIPLEHFSDNILNLCPGRYIVNLEYATDAENIQVTVLSTLNDQKLYNGKVIVNNYILKPAYTEHSFEFWVTGIGQQVTVKVDYLTEEWAEVYSIEVCQTRFIKWNILLFVLLVIAATFMIYNIKDKKCSIKKETIITVLICSGLIFFLSFPLFTPYVYIGFDSKFHMIRIEGIKDGLLAGQFPVRIDPTFINGYGYAVPTYYGSLFFYFPAILRLIGYDLQTSFKALLILINCVTVTSSYLCFKEIGSGRKLGIVGSVMYSASLYKFCNMYQRGAIGESIAMAVLPIIGLALWNIYTKPHDEKYKSRWILLTTGFTLVLHSHIISTEIFAIMSIFVCLVNFKKTFQKDTFMVLLKFAIAVCLINLSFLVPFIDGVFGFQIVINKWNSPNLEFQNTGISIKNIFSVMLPKFWEEGIPEMELYYYPGIAMGIGVLAVFVVLLSRQLKDRNKRNIYLFFTFIAILTVWLSSSSFPWNKILWICVVRLGVIGKLAANFITKIQFAFRFASLATFTLTCAVIFSIYMLHDWNRNAAKIFIYIISLVTIVQCAILEITNEKITLICRCKISSIKNTDDLDNQFIIGEEYAPVVGDASLWSIIGNRTCYTDMEVSDFKKKYTNMTFTVNNESDEYGWIEVPLLYYPGYEAINSDTGEKINLIQSNTMRIAFEVQPHTMINVSLYYKGKPLWIFADIVSLIALIVIFVISSNRKDTYENIVKK